jgi:signal transduction histidine kinase
VLCYLVAWALMPDADAVDEPGGQRDADVVSTIAFGAVVFGGLLLVRAVGLWPGDVIVWPLAAAIAGLALLAMRTGTATPAAELPAWPILGRLPPDAADALAVLVGTRRGALARVIAGGACVATGVVAFVITADSWSALRGAFVASIAVLAGIALVIGPGLSRLAHALVDEKRERIRADERAEVAAHLHDSVLQTLALIQKRAGDPREVAGLARRQERELRRWLFERPGAEAKDSVKAMLERAVAEVEELHGVPVESVVVGDAALDTRLEALVQATREAMTNAAKFSGAARVDLYAEIDGAHIEVFVRDRGVGFDPQAIPPDRRGVRDSIIGRMERYGGHVWIRSEPGEGTEVELSLERSRSERGPVAMSPVGSP